MATAYSVFANGGYATWPHAIKEIYTRDGYQIYVHEPDFENRIIREKDAQRLTRMLENVIEKGTGRRHACRFWRPERPERRRITAMPGLWGTATS